MDFCHSLETYLNKFMLDNGTKTGLDTANSASRK